MISDLLTALGYGVSWKFWLIPGAAAAVVAFFAVSRFFGLRNGLYAAALVSFASLTQILMRRAKQEGWNERINKEKRDGERMVDRAERAGGTVPGVGSDRLRDDDGFKRH